MPSPEQNPSPYEDSDIVDFLREKQIGNPDFMRNLANRLWQATSQEERNLLELLSAVDTAGNSSPPTPEDKENYFKAVLLGRFISTVEARDYVRANRQEDAERKQLISELEWLFELPTANGQPPSAA